jgi:hypothetical protein
VFLKKDGASSRRFPVAVIEKQQERYAREGMELHRQIVWHFHILANNKAAFQLDRILNRG